MRATIADVGVPVLTGATSGDIRSARRNGEPLFNQAVVFDGGGEVVDVYRKTHLVPYGEYIPWKPVVGWISALEQIAYELTPGERLHTLSAPGLPRFGAPICFENSFPALDRELVRQGARVPRRPHEQRGLRRDGRVRAASADVPDARDRGRAMGGPCRRVGHQRVHRSRRAALYQQTGLFEPAVIRRTIRASTDRTLSVRWGDWLPIVSLVFVVGMAAVPRSRRRDRPGPEPLAPGAANPGDPADLRRSEDDPRGHRRRPGLPGVDALVVDDSSPDGTGDIVRGLMTGEPRLRLVERPARSGLASAYLEGFGRALDEGYDLIVEMDSDLSHDPAQLGVAARGRPRSVPPRRRQPLRAGGLGDELEPRPARPLEGRATSTPA